jgi:hypothetical protein
MIPLRSTSRLGCVCLIKSMMAIDPTITFTGATITPVEPDPAKPAPAKPALLDLILNFITAIFGGKK